MINRKACPILLVFSTMIIFCFYVPKVYTAEVSTTFWEEPQKKWNEYLAAMSKYECSMREQIQWPTEKRDHSIEVIGQYPQFISTVSSADNQEIVLGFNTKYSFKIHRDKASTSDWIVDTLEPFSADMVFQTL